MKDLIEFLLKNIVNKPDEVFVEEAEGKTFDKQESHIYNIKVNKNDIGIVIGKHGQTIKSIRNIVKVRAVKEHLYVDVRLNEDIPE